VTHTSSAAVAIAKVVEGSLKMTNTLGQTSASTFRIEATDKGRVLRLTYTSGQRPENYILMSEADETQERARLDRMLRSGELAPLERSLRDIQAVPAE
jgi:hypothetical protein